VTRDIPATDLDTVGGCAWCDGSCAGVDITALLDARLSWLWYQLAASADRRGDPDLTTGTVTLVAPPSAEERAAAVGLLGGRVPSAGQRTRVNLADLTSWVQGRHPAITPGMVAAHAAGRRLAAKARAKAAQSSRAAHFHRVFTDLVAGLPANAPVRPDVDQVWPVLRRAGWVARMVTLPHAELLLRQTVEVIAALPAPGARIDRRRLADKVTRFPHALDSGPLPGLVLAVLTAAGVTPAGVRTRQAWGVLGVDFDDLTGGLVTIGVHPVGWVIPASAVVTLPPRELAKCTWAPPPYLGASVFVTENPSVAAAAVDLAGETGDGEPVRLLCTVGTPSELEITAMGRLSAAGWRIRVRADFDAAGLSHVAAILAGVPRAVPWRMSVGDYLDSLAAAPPGADVALVGAELPTTPWDPKLRTVMADRALAAFEETLTDDLLVDLRDPPRSDQPQ
jgi:uncharacterized protein (TIGR02679 family)